MCYSNANFLNPNTDPGVDQLHLWLDGEALKVIPKFPTGKAMTVTVFQVVDRIL